MTWQLSSRLKEKNYPDVVSKNAFRRGYKNGFHRGVMRPGVIDPNAYSAGYWEGYADGEDTGGKEPASKNTRSKAKGSRVRKRSSAIVPVAED